MYLSGSVAALKLHCPHLLVRTVVSHRIPTQKRLAAKTPAKYGFHVVS